MDGKTEEGCEQTSLPGSGQGSVGGSISSGNGQVHDSKTPIVCGSLVALRTPNGIFQYTVVSIHEFQDAVTVENGIGQVICRRSELKHWAEHALEVFTEKQADYRKKYEATIGLWNKGLNTPKLLAAALNILPMHAGSRIATLKTYQLIEDPKPIPNENTSGNPPADVPSAD